MTCLSCGSQLSSSHNENHPLVGLSAITLLALSVERCQDCGEFEIAIPRHSRLMEILTHALLHKRGRLVGQEIRWLRGTLGMTGRSLAQHLGVSPEAVSKWEGNRMNQSPTADLLLRLLVARRLGQGVFPDAALPLVETPQRIPLRIRLRFQDGDWRLEEGSKASLVADPTSSAWLPFSP